MRKKERRAKRQKKELSEGRREGGEKGERRERRIGRRKGRDGGIWEVRGHSIFSSPFWWLQIDPSPTAPRFRLPELNAEIPLDPLHQGLKSQEGLKSKCLFCKYVLSTGSCLHLCGRRAHLLQVYRDTVKTKGQDRAPAWWALLKTTSPFTYLQAAFALIF